jgi:hypothetical protein
VLQQRSRFEADGKRGRSSRVNIEAKRFVVDMRSTIRLHFVSVVVLFFALSSTLMLSVSATGNQEVSASTISEAEQLMAQAYEAVLDAERVGADVSGLLVRLNDAAAMLSQARMAFEVGDFEEAIRFAESRREIEYEVVDEARWLETEAINAQVQKSWRFLVTSALGISTVLVASILGYQYFKRRYYKRLSKMKPRVGEP